MTFGGGGRGGFLLLLDAAAEEVLVAAAAVAEAVMVVAVVGCFEAMDAGRGREVVVVGAVEVVRAYPGCAGSWCAREEGPVAIVDAIIACLSAF